MANHSQLTASFFKKTIKWFLYFLLLVITILALAYWSAPYWVPNQVQSFLPNEFKINQLKLERPGLRSAFVNQLELDISLDSEIKVRLENIELSYSLLQKKLTGIKAEKAYVQVDSENSSQTSNFSNRIPIPKIPIESIEIDQLTISGLFIQDLDFEEFSFKSSNQYLQINSQLTFIGLNFAIDSQINSSNQILSEFKATILQNTDRLKLSIKPQLESSAAFAWSVDGLIDTANYYPIEGLSSIEVLGSGVFEKDKNYKLLLHNKFSIKAPVDLAVLNVRNTVETLLDDKNLNVDLSQINKPILINIQATQDSELSLEPHSYLLSLTKGSLPVSISHPVTQHQIKIQRLKLNPNFALSDPVQLIAGNIKSQLHLQKLQYQQGKLKFNSKQLAVNFSAPFIINNANLELFTQELHLNIGEAKFVDANISTNFPTTQWQGNAKIFQNLVGDDHANSQSIALNQSKPLSISLYLTNEVVKLLNLSNQIKFDGQNISILSDADSVNLSQQDLNASQIKAKTRLNLANSSINGTANFSDASFSNEQVAINPFSAAIDWEKISNQITANGKIYYLSKMIPFNYRINLKADQHNLNISPLNLSAVQISHWLSPILHNYPSLTIEQGEITSPRLTGNPFDLAFDGKVKLSNLDLSYDKLKVINLQLNEHLESSEALKGTTTGNIETIKVATGIDITELQFFLTHGIDNFNFSDIYGRLLKGSLYIPELTITPNKVAPFTANLKEIDFGQLLEALEAQSLAIQGLFNFKLPISITENSQTISNGHFMSVGSGILKIDSGESADSNIAFQALKNFHYQEFSGTINYSDQGIYQLDFLLIGANPNLYDGFPIELKMKVEGNLPNLLYSMLISGDMAKPIIDKYQSGELDLPLNQ